MHIFLNFDFKNFQVIILKYHTSDYLDLYTISSSDINFIFQMRTTLFTVNYLTVDILENRCVPKLNFKLV